MRSAPRHAAPPSPARRHRANTSAPLPAAGATKRPSPPGRARTTGSPCRKRRRNPSSATSAIGASATPAVTSTFFRRDGRFYVNTDGPDGRPADFEIKYTFGVTPLQQYLVAFPGGRLQALPIAWDARPKSQGGQRWFHLYPGQRITPRDPLHWTRLNQNWNWMCADCHSTDLRRNYDSASDSFKTAWSEINVSCEACHGPGSAHAAWANKAPGWEKMATGASRSRSTSARVLPGR